MPESVPVLQSGSPGGSMNRVAGGTVTELAVAIRTICLVAALDSAMSSSNLPTHTQSMCSRWCGEPFVGWRDE